MPSPKIRTSDTHAAAPHPRRPASRPHARSSPSRCANTDRVRECVQRTTHTFDKDAQVRAEVPVGHRGEVELPAYESAPTPIDTLPMMGTTGNTSSTGAPAKYSCTGGPGTLAA